MSFTETNVELQREKEKTLFYQIQLKHLIVLQFVWTIVHIVLNLM